MGFQRLRSYHFRNLRDGTVDVSGPQVFFIGENGQGKTNFLEALYVLSYGGSFRTRRDGEMIRHGESDLALSASYGNGEDNDGIELRIQKSTKSIVINGKAIQDRREIVSRFPVILFRHDDLQFVSGPPELQRFFIDQTLSLYNPLHIEDLRSYRKVLKNRNMALKDRSLDLLPVYDRQLAEQGLPVQKNREMAIDAFNTVFRDLFTGISGLDTPVEVSYRPSWKIPDDGSEGIQSITDLFQKKRDNEISLGTTLHGPHRDRIGFRYRGRDFTEEASTGQLRLTSLILRIAQARLFHDMTGRRPVLLLDDVLLELDPERRERALQALPEAEQKIFTFLPGEPFLSYRDDSTLVYSVRDGEFERT